MNVVNVSSKVVGVQQRSMNELFECRIVSKARMILGESTHVLAKHYELMPSSKRFRTLKCSTNRARMSFVNRSVEYLNKKGV